MPEALLDLAAPRVITIHDRGSKFTFKCRRVLADVWQKYFESIVISSEQSGRDRINVVDVDSPRILLAETVLESAAGYTLEDGSDLMTLENWVERVPRGHRMKLGELLAKCTLSEQADFTIRPEAEVVSLDCIWTLNGAMAKFIGLKHFLRTPSEEQFRRYKREASRTVVVGGSRSGRTLYRGAQLLLAELWDELVIDVEGYTFGGVAASQDRAGARQLILDNMDTMHKFIAAQAIFQPVTPDGGEDE